MSSATALIEWRERVVTFGRTQSLVGVLTQPRTVKGPPVVLFGAGIIHRVGPSRASVLLARRLAEQGHAVVRFDLAGIGDSPRSDEARLEDAAIADMRDAITLLSTVPGNPWGDRVVSVGFCSGADNSFWLAADEPRLAALVLFDPTVHKTPGFQRRELTRRLTSAQAWGNLLSGRALRGRMGGGSGGGDDEQSIAAQPPEYFGLLVADADDARRRADILRARGARLLYLLSRGAQHYCNGPEQVEESLGPGFEVIWAPEIDHVFSQRAHIPWLCDTVAGWVAGLPETAPG